MFKGFSPRCNPAGSVQAPRAVGASIAIVTLLCAGCGLNQPPPMASAIDYSSAEVVAGAAGGFDLIVRGMTGTPCFAVSVTASTYIQQPDFWAYQVTAVEQSGNCAQVVTPFEVRVSLGSSVGTQGIEVNGRTKSERLPVPP